MESSDIMDTEWGQYRDEKEKEKWGIYSRKPKMIIGRRDGEVDSSRIPDCWAV